MKIFERVKAIALKAAKVFLWALAALIALLALGGLLAMTRQFLGEFWSDIIGSEGKIVFVDFPKPAL